jgi:hypothetical protein
MKTICLLKANNHWITIKELLGTYLIFLNDQQFDMPFIDRMDAFISATRLQKILLRK